MLQLIQADHSRRNSVSEKSMDGTGGDCITNPLLISDTPHSTASPVEMVVIAQFMGKLSANTHNLKIPVLYPWQPEGEADVW